MVKIEIMFSYIEKLVWDLVLKHLVFKFGI